MSYIDLLECIADAVLKGVRPFVVILAEGKPQKTRLERFIASNKLNNCTHIRLIETQAFALPSIVCWDVLTTTGMLLLVRLQHMISVSGCTIFLAVAILIRNHKPCFLWIGHIYTPELTAHHALPHLLDACVAVQVVAEVMVVDLMVQLLAKQERKVVVPIDQRCRLEKAFYTL
jgi:hypothetical protein